MHVHGSDGIHKKRYIGSGKWIGVLHTKRKKQNLLEKAVCNFNTYLLTHFKSFQNKANPDGAVRNLRNNQCYH